MRRAALALLISTSPALAAGSVAPFKGAVIAEDVDSFWIDGAHVRLNGVDGAEVNGKNERAGNEAARFLYELARGKEIVCTWNGEMTHGRFVVTCTLPDGADLGDTIVRAGFARDCRHFSGGRYEAAEQEAKAAGRGLWGSGEMPSSHAPYC